MIATGMIGAPVSTASLPAPWWGEPSASGCSTRVPSGKTTTKPPEARIEPGGHDRLGVGLATIHGKRAESQEQPPERAFEQLHLGHEPDVTVRGKPDEERVEEVLVVRGEDRGAAGRNVLPAGDPHSEPPAEHHQRQEPRDRVQRRQHPLAPAHRRRPNAPASVAEPPGMIDLPSLICTDSCPSGVAYAER